MHEHDLYVHLASIVEHTDDAVISKDLQGTILSFNPAAERMFGYSASEIIGKSILTLIPPERRGEEDEILSRLRRGQRIDHFETVRVAKDGRRIDISLTVSPVRGPDGEVIGASKIARDITEQKRAAASIAAQREWFRVTLNSIGDAVIASDPDGRVTFLNHEAERLTGWPLAEAEGRPLGEVFKIINETTRKEIANPAESVIKLGRVVGLANHTSLISRSGEEWPVADSAAPIVDRSGAIIGVVLVFREITELKRNEANTRTAAVERERLLQNERAARAEAERANRVKDDFVAMVSHELRTPLNAILGWTELLKKKTDDSAALERGLDVIARNTRLQAQLILDLLDVSRIVSGKLRLELERIDLLPVIRHSIEALQADAAERGVALTIDAGVTPIAMLGDPARLQQIIWNLASNAIKFTPKGGTVGVAVKVRGNRAEIIVTDSGVGIRPEMVTEIFERFRQGSSITTRRHGGLGLGLSITKHLTELHGGSIRAFSAGEHQGSTFTVELPIELEDAKSGALDRKQDQEIAAQADMVSLRDVKILVVEDDQDTRDLVRRMLEAYRAEVIVAATAPEALELLATTRPDLIVSDIGLPDVDGYEFIRRVRQMDPSIARIPAIALTAFARYEDRTQALRAGYNAHVAKPVEPIELVVTVGSFANIITSGPRR
jgi:PAS domain S-box-containing protein